MEFPKTDIPVSHDCKMSIFGSIARIECRISALEMTIEQKGLPTVPTVSTDPDSNTCFSTESASSAAANPASFLLQITSTRTTENK